MKERVFHRYERDADGRILIDVTATRTEDLYNDFDRSAPYIRRDLDQDLVDHLINCARELGAEPFAIRFTLDQQPDDDRLRRVRRSVNGFFLYLITIERHKVRRMARRSIVLLALGLCILALSVWFNKLLGPGESVVGAVFAQGLTVAAWVSLWEALATFLVDWFPSRADISLYRRLANAPLLFRTRQ